MSEKKKCFGNCEYSRFTIKRGTLVGVGNFCAYDAEKLNDEYLVHVIDACECEDCEDYKPKQG